jgi:zinc protease
LRIREKLGLAYYVGAQNFLGVVPGFFAFYAGTARDKLPQVEEELLKEVKLLGDEGFSEEELKRSKAKIIGQKKIARQDLGGYAITVALDELYGLGHDHIDLEDARYEAITLAGIKAVARKYLTPDALVLAIITPPPDS